MKLIADFENVIIFVIHLQRYLQKNTPNSQIYINIPREDSVISLLKIS